MPIYTSNFRYEELSLYTVSLILLVVITRFGHFILLISSVTISGFQTGPFYGNYKARLISFNDLKGDNLC